MSQALMQGRDINDGERMSITGTHDETAVGPAKRRTIRRRNWVIAVVCAVLLLGAAVPAMLILRPGPAPGSRRPVRYVGLYERTSPTSYAGVQNFAAATGVKPNMVMYYSPWQEPFQTAFASAAASHGAVPLVQMNPSGISLAKLAAGQYDNYLTAYARAVRGYGHPVIISFGHEMNGHWYSWAYTHTSPGTFVQAWRHIVTLFRSLDVKNVTWLWTVNIIDQNGGILPPASWWPGQAYVNWVGIDGYYYSPSVNFVSLFGPTITAVRELTGDPILIAETAVKQTASQPVKIDDLFAGIRLYGLLGAVWFQVQQWRLTSPGAIAAFRRDADADRTAGHGG